MGGGEWVMGIMCQCLARADEEGGEEKKCNDGNTKK